MTDAMAARLLRKPLYRAGAAVATGEADAMIAGAANSTARVIEAALMTVGPAPGIDTPSSFFLMEFQFVEFGCYTLERSSFYFVRSDQAWQAIDEESVLEKEFARAVVSHIKRLSPPNS